MILKFKTVKGHAGDVRVLSYIQAGSDQAAPMFTNMAGQSVQDLAREVAALRSLRPKLDKASAHLILNHSKDQRPLTEAEWRESLEISLTEHGAQDAPFAAWPHDDGQHLHVFLLRIRPDGSVISDSNSYRKNERAARAIEQRFGLDPPKPRAPEDRWPRDGGARGERGRRRFERLAASIDPPDQLHQKGHLKVINPHLIFEALDESKDIDDMRELLLKKGIEFELVKAPGAAEPTGWRLREVGPAGTWKKGSEVHRDLSLKNALDRMRHAQGQSLKRQPARNPYVPDPDTPRHQLRRSGGSLMGVLTGIGIEIGIRLVAGFINLIARALARKSKVPAETLGRIDVAEDGTPVFVEPVDLPVDAPADQHARVDSTRTVLARAMDQAAEAIRQDDTSKLPTLSDPEVVAERARVIEQLDQIEPEDDDEDGEEYERERPR